MDIQDLKEKRAQIQKKLDERDYSSVKELCKAALDFLDDMDKEMFDDETNEFRAFIFLSYAASHLSTGSIKEAKPLVDKGMDLAIETNEQSLLARGHSLAGAYYFYTGSYKQAIEEYKANIGIVIKQDNKKTLADSYMNMSAIYTELEKYDFALEYAEKSLEIFKKIKEINSVALLLNNRAMIYDRRNQIPKAIASLEEAVQISQEHNLKIVEARALGNLAYFLNKSHQEERALSMIREAIQKTEDLGNERMLAYWLQTLGVIYMKEGAPNCSEALEVLNRALKIAKKHELRSLESELLPNLSKAYKLNNDFPAALDSLENSIKIIDELNEAEAASLAEQYEHDLKILKINKEHEIKDAVAAEQEKLLKNVLPEAIADRMIKGEESIADIFENISIFFSDIVGFTKISSQLSPSELVKLLNSVFEEFDAIAEKYNVEKIKTIGDAYLAVAGIEEADKHAENMMNFAIEVNKAMEKFKTSESKPIQLRIGIHCGEATAGIIGKTKFFYDIWGDAVNVASRMETTGEPGKIHCSEDFIKALGMDLADKRLTARTIHVKGIGEMRTFYILV